MAGREYSIERDMVHRAVPAARAAPASQRVLWLDVAKGLGIILVVIGHALGGLIDSPAGRGFPQGREIFLAIYVFHMPLFFFLSGLLVRPRIDSGRTAFFLNLLATVVYPYFLWSIIQYSAIYAAGSLVNRPVAVFWAPILHLPWASISQFWYLYVLFLLHIAALLIVPRLGARGFFLLALAGKFLVPLFVLPVMLRLSLVHGAFYALGLWMGVGGIEAVRARLAGREWWTVLALPIAAGAIILASRAIIAAHAADFAHLGSWEITAFAWRLPILPAAFVAAASCIVVALALRGPLAEILAYLGRRTMVIFVLHVLFIAGLRIMLTRLLHHPNPVLILTLCVLAGLILPLAVHSVARRFTKSRVLGFG